MHKTVLDDRNTNLDITKVNSTTDRVTLKDDEPDVVQCYFDYAYTGLLHTVFTPEEGKPVKSAVTSEYSLLCKAYVFGERIEDQDFTDAVASALLCRFETAEEGFSGWVPNSKIINRAYSVTDVGSVLRRLLVDIYVWGHKEGMPSADDLNAEFSRDMGNAALKAMRAKGPVDDGCLIPLSVRSCDYHGHDEDEDCPDHRRSTVGSAERGVGVMEPAAVTDKSGAAERAATAEIVPTGDADASNTIKIKEEGQQDRKRHRTE